MSSRNRPLLNARTTVKKTAKQPSNINYGFLAEDYDGIGQYVLITLSKGSVGSAYKARVASGDFGTGRVFPVGTPVSLHSHRGQLEILSLGVKPKQETVGYSSIHTGIGGSDNIIQFHINDAQIAQIWYTGDDAPTVSSLEGSPTPTWTFNGGLMWLTGHGFYQLALEHQSMHVIVTNLGDALHINGTDS